MVASRHSTGAITESLQVIHKSEAETERQSESERDCVVCVCFFNFVKCVCGCFVCFSVCGLCECLPDVCRCPRKPARASEALKLEFGAVSCEPALG